MFILAGFQEAAAFFEELHGFSVLSSMALNSCCRGMLSCYSSPNEGVLQAVRGWYLVAVGEGGGGGIWWVDVWGSHRGW